MKKTIRQTYWPKKAQRVPIPKQRNDDDRLGGKLKRRMTEKQVIKMYIDQTKEWKPKATKKDIETQIQLAKMSYAENEGSN